MRLEQIPGFVVEVSSEHFDPNNLVRALRQVAQAGNGIDWMGLTGRPNPLTVAFYDLEQLAAEFPRTSVEYREEAIAQLLLNILSGIREVLDVSNLRASNLTSLKHYLTLAEEQLELSHEWDDDEQVESFSFSLLVVGANAGVRAFSKTLAEGLNAVRQSFDYLVPDPSDELPELPGMARLRLPLIHFPTLELCYNPPVSLRELFSKATITSTELLNRLRALPGNPYAQVAQEFAEMESILRQGDTRADFEEHLARVQETLGQLREDLRKDSDPNVFVLRRTARRFAEIFDEIETWDEPLAEKSIAACCYVIPFRGPHGKICAVAQSVLDALADTYEQTRKLTAESEGWRHVEVDGVKMYLPPSKRVGPDEIPLPIDGQEARSRAPYSNNGERNTPHSLTGLDEATSKEAGREDFGGNSRLSAAERDQTALLVD